MPLLMGPDPIPVEYQLDPKITRLGRMMMERQIHNRPPIGSLASDMHGGDGKVRSGGPWNLAFRWLWGSPEFKNRTSDLSYDGDDELTQSLIKSTSMADARSTIAAEYAWSGKKESRADYSTTKNRDKEDLNYLQMVGVYASDFGGLIVGKEDRKAQGVLG
ncbi:hypothetical protein AB0M23_02220 [Streptomyces sp. NPDC052077]|uniref:hypothetical protein n=1 Tax=Streptomyces sp. NPDC052077 TaxID=3154757 RepID=UPI003427AC65